MSRLALVVEDDAGLRAIYRRVLQTIQYDVFEAQDGEQAIAFLKENTPDIIFLDILLPIVNGIDVLEYMYPDAELRNTYIVVVSSNKQFESHAAQFPNAKFVLKPIRPAMIREFAEAASPA